jgi:hypothetical protein
MVASFSLGHQGVAAQGHDGRQHHQQIAPPALDAHVGLIDIPAGSHHAVTPLAQGFTRTRSPLHLPRPHRFMGNDDAPPKEHFRPIPQAELVPEAPEDDQTDDIRRLWQTVKWGPRALITLPRAQTTAESTVAQFRTLESFGNRAQLPVGASHAVPPFGAVRLRAVVPKTKLGGNLTEPRRAHGSTSVAWDRTDGGIASPMACAVWLLMTSSKVVGASIESSPGLAPLRMRST